MMRDSTTFTHRSSRSREERSSIESSILFASFRRDSLFNDEELLDAFQSMNDMSLSSIPPVQFDKRPSAKYFEWSCQERIFNGEDLVDVFQSDQDMTMGQSASETFNHSVGPIKDLSASLSEMIIEKPTPKATTQDTHASTNEDTQSSPIEYNTPAETAPSTVQNKKNTIIVRDDEEDNNRIEYIDNIRPYDIICGRNNGAHNCVGNRRFRITIMMNLKQYAEAPNRDEKTQVIKSVIELLLDTEEANARFIKKVGDGMYIRLKGKQIREKVGHAFRDMIALQEKEAKKLEDKCFR